MSEPPAWRELAHLLHDGRLRHLEWEPSLGQACLQFECLRREEDGRALSEPVEFGLGGVKALVVGYDRANARPSAYKPSHVLTEAELRQWVFGPQPVFVMMNAPGWEEDVMNALHVDWLHGCLESLRACPFRLGVCVGPYRETMTMLWGCEEFAVYSAGLPLNLDTWQCQFRAWWNHWTEHWRVTDGNGSRLEDTIIPAAKAPAPDLSYQPPREPAVDWEPTDAPAGILTPITDWFEANHQRDFARLAKAWPNRNFSAEERVSELAADFQRTFGRWGYARQVEQWWVEEPRAEVIIRGIEHQKAITGADSHYPTQNLESVWTFYLQKSSGAWVIRTWSQGWPRYNSAPAKPAAQKSWLQQWKSGKVVTGPAKRRWLWVILAIVLCSYLVSYMVYWWIMH